MRSVEEHLSKILELVDAASAVRAAAARGAGPADLRGHHVVDRPARASTTRRWTATPCTSPTSPTATERRRRSGFPVVGESAAGQTKAYALSPGPGGQDHDRCADAGGRRRGRPDRVDRRRSRHASRSRRRRRSASTSGRAATTSGPATGCLRGGRHDRSARGDDPGGDRARPGAGAAATARRRALDRVASCASRARRSASTRSTTPTRSRSRPRRGRPTPSPTGSASSPTTRRSSPTRCRTSSSAPTWSSRPAA